MGVWVLVVAYLAIFLLLQYAIYRYVDRDDDGTPATWGHVPNAEVGSHRDRSIDRDRSGDAEPRGDRLDEDAHADVDGKTRRCPTCGAENAAEPVYRFCRHCAGPLGR